MMNEHTRGPVVRTCPDCAGAGENGHGHTCYTCDGQGGVVPYRQPDGYRLDGSIYVGMEACIAHSGRTVAHFPKYSDAVQVLAAIAKATDQGGEG